MVTDNPANPPGQKPSATPPRSQRRLTLLVVVCLLLGTGIGVYLIYSRKPAGRLPDGTPPDPQEYAGPFRNLDPSIKYVSDERCGDCHAEHARTYANHPMSRSIHPIARIAGLPEDPQHHDPFEALGSQFSIGHDVNHKMMHRRARLDTHGHTVAEMSWEVHYSLGSGSQGYSFLTDRDGYVFQTPVSWFSQKKLWDLSPGFRPSHLTGRGILPDCLFCHANHANHFEGSVNRYTEPLFDGYAIGCQRCHGPGELHVASKEHAIPDYTIVNPRHLEPSFRQAVCEQCHLQGKARTLHRARGQYDFRPGLGVEQVWSVFLLAGSPKEDKKAVGHVEQMYLSRCFEKSSGPFRLGCISCHDPHEQTAPAQRVNHYRSRCLECHRDDASANEAPKKEKKGLDAPICSLPVAERLKKENSCMECHMPRYGSSDIPHAASTDHRILLRGKTSAAQTAKPAVGDGLPIVSFYNKGTEDAEGARDRAVVIVKLALSGEAAFYRALGQSLPVLEAALSRDPSDLAAGEARGYALAMLNKGGEALEAFQSILEKAPDRELVLVGAATTAEELKKTEMALEYWRRAILANPWEPGYRRHFVLLSLKREAWAEAMPDCDAWLRLDPMSIDARKARLTCLLSLGNKKEARAEFARLEALAPKDLRELQIRFENRLK